MNGRSRRRALLSVAAMVGVLMMLGQLSAFAQSADPEGQVGTQQIRSFLLWGGAYQVIEQAAGNCDGRCNVINE